jgi:hypothetical protein
LVTRLAEHAWLSRRAQCLQDGAIIANSPHNLALFLRYQTTNDRAFHKCLAELSAMRRERRRQAAEFESQTRQQERHQLAVRLANAQIARAGQPQRATTPTNKQAKTVLEVPDLGPNTEKDEKAAA